MPYILATGRVTRAQPVIIRAREKNKSFGGTGREWVGRLDVKVRL